MNAYDASATDALRTLADDTDLLREANLAVGWDCGPEQGAWLRALAEAIESMPTHHFRGVPGCQLRPEGVNESPNCWCPRNGGDAA